LGDLRSCGKGKAAVYDDLRKTLGKSMLQFLTPEEHRLIDDVGEMIIPADENRPAPPAHA
jgi:hypothetical protein